MQDFFSVDTIISLFTLTILEIVLGIDNVIFVSILMGPLNKKQQKRARQIWMIAGIFVRTVLLLTIGMLVNNGGKVLFSVFNYGFSVRNVIMFFGGLFLLYKTVREIHDKLEGADEAASKDNQRAASSFASVLGQIVFIDMIFSFDSIITAIGLARKVPVMIIAVILAMLVMFFFAEKISTFIHKHPTLKMLALSFLLMVGFSLFFEGLEPIHHAHIDKGYIYFAMAFSFVVEMLNLWMRKRKAKPVSLKEPVLTEPGNEKIK